MAAEVARAFAELDAHIEEEITQAALRTMKAEIARKDEQLSCAWGVIANASRGNWSSESEEWRLAAEAWRDDWLRSIKSTAKPLKPQHYHRDDGKGYCPDCGDPYNQLLDDQSKGPT